MLVAELLGASGVLAVVVAGLVVAYASARISTAASRHETESVWPLGAYMLNGALFVLVGLEVEGVGHNLSAAAVGRLVPVVLATWVGLLLMRFIFPQLAVLVIRAWTCVRHNERGG